MKVLWTNRWKLENPEVNDSDVCWLFMIFLSLLQYQFWTNYLPVSKYGSLVKSRPCVFSLVIASVSATYCVPISSDLYLSNTGSCCVSDLNDIDRKNTSIIIYRFGLSLESFVHRNLLYFLSICAPLGIVTYTMAMIRRWRTNGASFPIHTDKMKRVIHSKSYIGVIHLPSYSYIGKELKGKGITPGN